MKTAISIPDDVFYTVKELSQRLGLSRSELYAKAVAAFLQLQRAAGAKAGLDAIHVIQESQFDPVLARLQALSLPRQEW